MLERTAGCVETSSLRRLLPASRAPLRSRRTLHSGFWNHTVGDIQFSPLWTALIQAAEPFERQVPDQQKGSNGAGTILLDFLYPGRTLKFLRRYSGADGELQEARKGRLGTSKVGYRQYTSSAQTVSLRNHALETSQNSDDAALQYIPQLKQLISVEGYKDFEGVWQQFVSLDGNEQAQARGLVIQYLSDSHRIVDAERIIELYEALKEHDLTPIIYESTIRALLRIRNVADAITLQHLAHAKIGPGRSAQDIMFYMIKNFEWQRASNFWSEVKHIPKYQDNGQYGIFATITQIPGLANKALELVEHIKQCYGSVRPRETASSSEMVKFAAKVIRKALQDSDTFEASCFMSLLQTLQDWQLDDSLLYQSLVRMLMEIGNTSMAVACYRKARQRPSIRPSKKLLHNVLDVFSSNLSVLGMQQVLDDFFRFHTRPSDHAYMTCMIAFSRLGNAETVRGLFDQFAERLAQSKASGPQMRAANFVPLLHVHAKRGEIDEVVTIFNQIEDKYGLKPSLACYNSLIHAYGIVHDVDNAFNTFKKLLHSYYVRPDDYTFGTLMGICATRGDLHSALELYKLAENMNITKTTAMMDCLVLGHLQQENLREAERICEDSAKTQLKGNRTRMWDYVLTAYAMRRDLENVDRLIRRMTELNVSQDTYTYAALMQVLAMVKQPDRAYAILKDVMPAAGVRTNSFHYAIVMGGYIANGEIHKVFQVQNRMVDRGITPSASTELINFKATTIASQQLPDTDNNSLDSALQVFERTIRLSENRQGVAYPPARKGFSSAPLDVAYSGAFYSYILFVLAQLKQFSKVEDLYQEFMKTLADLSEDSPPVDILSAMMIAKFNENDFVAVEELWGLTWAQAKKQGTPFNLKSVANLSATQHTPAGPPANRAYLRLESVQGNGHVGIIVAKHQLDLARPLTTYMRALGKEGRIDDLQATINGLLKDGFVLDQANWNLYISILAKSFKYQEAFQLCENKLMEGWTGWQQLRWQAPVSNYLPIVLRNQRKLPRYLRPYLRTLLTMARAYMEISSTAIESTDAQFLLDWIERRCENTVRAIKTMPRTNSAEEREYLAGM